MADARRAPKRRLFFALWPSDHVRQQIAAANHEALLNAGPNAVPAVNFHVTLAFLGAVSAESVPDIVAEASRARFLAFTLVLERTGYWPRSQVAWLAPAECPLPLSALVDDLWNKLGGMGFAHEASQYRPHLTLARQVADGCGARLSAPLRWPVSSFVLAESRPAAAGPVYTVLEQFSAGA